MNGLDIILLLPLTYAVYRGFKVGILAQLAGILGVVVGVWLAFRLGPETGKLYGLEGVTATCAGFVTILAICIILIGTAGWLLGKIFKMIGLGLLNRIGGVVFSVFKMILILGVLLPAFHVLNTYTGIVQPEQFSRSVLYRPVSQASGFIFPYLAEWKNVLDQNLQE